jgi:hypothetical protein
MAVARICPLLLAIASTLFDGAACLIKNQNSAEAYIPPGSMLCF